MLRNPCRPEDDLKALARLSERDLPTIDDSMRALADRQAARSREGLMTEVIRKAGSTPWLAPVTAGALAAVLLFVPISYDKTTSYDVKLALAGPASGSPALAGEQVTKIATEFQKALHAEGININTSGDRVELTAHVPTDRAAGVAGVARAFAAELKARHIEAEATVSAVTSKVQGNVYAMAMSRVINVNVNTNGKSDTQIADEIKAQIQAAGFEATSVEYSTEGNKRTIKIVNENNDPNAPHNDAEAPEINLTLDGQAPPPDAHKVKLEIQNQPGDTDEVIRRRVVDQLKAQGMDAEVVVTNGKIVSINPIKH